MKRRFSLAMTLVLAMVMLPELSSMASGPSQRKASFGRKITQSPSEVKRYWTPARLKSAKPKVVHAPPGRSSSPTRSRNMPTSKPRRIEPSRPASGSPVAIRLTRDAHRSQQTIPFTRTEIVNVTDYPYVTHGKLFFSVGSFDYVCSATVVDSPAKNVIATAGHCLYDTESDGYSSNVLFVPGYRNGNMPLGSWTAEELFVRNEWKNEDFDYDFAAATLGTNGGDEVQDVTGSRGIIFNQSGLQLFDAYGYPAASPFDGSKLYMCDSGPSLRDGSYAIAPVAIGCDMTGGSSGGGWVINDAYVNSVTSYGYTELPNVLFGTYLGTAAETVYDAAVDAGGVDPTPTPTPTATPTSTPTATPTPSPTPTEPPEVITHPLGLTLNLKKHLKAKGVMTALDGYTPCAAGAPVQIYRLINPTTGTFVKGGTTMADGRYTIKIKDRKGKYFAYSPEGPVDDLNFCEEVFSPLKRHRH